MTAVQVRRTETLLIRLTPQEAIELERAAKIGRTSKSDFVRTAVRMAAERFLVEAK